jgi:chemotaxis protein CheD
VNQRPNGGAQRCVNEGEVFLQPGEYFVGSGCRVRTLLGSCVSITLWHPRLRVGAMSHFLLWSRGASGVAPGGRHTAVADGRYGAEVLPLMLRELAALGVRPEACQGKLFGGGDMFPAQGKARTRVSPGVGLRNGSAAREMLAALGITLVSESLFGVGHRQIAFDLRNGDVWSRQVQPQPPQRAVPSETT